MFSFTNRVIDINFNVILLFEWNSVNIKEANKHVKFKSTSFQKRYFTRHFYRMLREELRLKEFDGQ